MKWAKWPESLKVFAGLVAVGILGVLIVGVFASTQKTLSWDAPTAYTDNTTITDPIQYQAYWTTDQTLATGLTPLGGVVSTTSVGFDVDASGMARGSTIYFTVVAIVNGVSSGYSATLQWDVPYLFPGVPTNLRLS